MFAPKLICFFSIPRLFMCGWCLLTIAELASKQCGKKYPSKSGFGCVFFLCNYPVSLVWMLWDLGPFDYKLFGSEYRYTHIYIYVCIMIYLLYI